MAWVWSWVRRLVTDGRARLVLFTKISLPVSVLTGGWKLVLAVPYESLLLAITGLYAVTCIPMVVGTESWTKNYTEVAGIAIAGVTGILCGVAAAGLGLRILTSRDPAQPTSSDGQAQQARFPS